MSDNLFFSRFRDILDYTKAPKITEIIRPKDGDFDPGKIGAFADVIGSAMQTGQTFRNLFNNGISPSDIAVLAKNGLTSEVTKLISKNGLSNYFSAAVGFDKTRFNYRESEKKLPSANLKINFNPLNIFQEFLERAARAKDDETDKAITDFYTSLNIARKRIFDTNSDLYIVVNKILEIHQIHDLESYTVDLKKIFTTSDVYDEVFTGTQQVKHVNNVLYRFTASYNAYLKYIKDKQAYIGLIEELTKIIGEFGRVLTFRELNYLYEDFKTLRRIDDTVPFKPL